MGVISRHPCDGAHYVLMKRMDFLYGIIIQVRRIIMKTEGKVFTKFHGNRCSGFRYEQTIIIEPQLRRLGNKKRK